MDPPDKPGDDGKGWTMIFLLVILRAGGGSVLATMKIWIRDDEKADEHPGHQ
jgi:hypothetical protein